MSPDFRSDCRQLYLLWRKKWFGQSSKVKHGLEDVDNTVVTGISLSVRTEFTTVVVCPLKTILHQAVEEAHV